MAKDPMPAVERDWNDIAEDFDAIYTGEGKSRTSRTMDRFFRRDMYQRFDWVMSSAGDVEGRSVCDFGCGSGRFMVELAKRGADRVMGVDVAPNMISLAEKLIEREGVSDVCELTTGDVLELQTDERFDITIAIGFWDYIADPSTRLEVIRRMTTGRFLSAWPRLWTWRAPIRKARLTAQGCPVYFFRREQVERLLEDAGFQVESVSVIGKLFCVEASPRA